MFLKISYFIFAIATIIISCPSALAEMGCIPDTQQGIGALGRIEPRSRVIKLSHNAGPEGARVEQLLFQEADQVKSGQTLAILSDQRKKTAEVETARARVKVLQAQREIEHAARVFNKREHVRYQSLKHDSATSISLAEAKRLAFEQSDINVKRLSAEIALAQSEVKVKEVELNNMHIVAPINGTILKIYARPGERIGDKSVLEMADLTELDAVAEVYESDLLRVKVGQSACVHAVGFKRVYNAQVREVGFLVRKNDLNDTDPLTDRDNRIIEVRLTLESEAVTELQHQIFRQVKIRIIP